MKTRFNTYDLVCSVTELQRLIGMRVNQIYDIDHRTYLIRFQRSEEKCVLLLESGNRIHTTGFEWPKNIAPSGFSMKMRKHLKNKRLESLMQVGIDRIIDLQFGSGEAAYHIILELYDRGNIILTDHEMVILYILRPHTEGDKIRFAVREKYPLDRAHNEAMPPIDEIHEHLQKAKTGESLKKVLNPILEFGSAVIDHVLLKATFALGCKISKDFNITEDMPKLILALEDANNIMDNAKKSASKGYIIQKKEARPTQDGKEEFIFANIEFHPLLFEQYKDQPYKEFDSFDATVDEYFSTMEGQKLDLKALQQEREALKKLENVRKDHDQRLITLEKTQEVDKQKAELISRNQTLVDNAILAIQSALANQMSWPDIQVLLKEAQARSDPVASAIKQLKLETNHISLLLHDPYEESDEESELKPMIIDVDLAHTAFGNARKYYSQKRSAAKKQQKTIESHGKALKSAEKKTKQTLKEVQTIHSIIKLRKVYWFEKFYWFITSENYLVIGGRDQQQNELIVKRYLRAGDLYVHADLTGASSVVIKNPTGGFVPPKSLAEAGTMAIAYSVAWDAKVVANAWWVHHDQVSKSAPTGEYLTTGSFMIRGKKNYLPPSQLIMGLGIMFRLEENSIERHKDERKVKAVGEESENVDSVIEDDKEIELEGDSDEDENLEDKNALNPIHEEDHLEPESCATDNKDANKDEGNDEEEEEEEDDTKCQFPDTQIKLDLSGPKVKLHVDNNQPLIATQKDAEENVVYLGDDKPVIVNLPIKEKRAKTKQKVQPKEPKEKIEKSDKTEIDNKKIEQPVLKRGQKGKLKKMKEKYKDQDEEDRRLSMLVLQSAGAAKEDKKKNRSKDLSSPKLQGKKKPNVRMNVPAPSAHIIDNADEEDTGPTPEVDMLEQLTGKPFPEDELLFAVPVVAPYSTLLNYKFKVKLTPGIGKRGKAAKTAIAVFLRDKEISSHEKDLLKAIKDEMLARNIPGKVKISAPQIQKLKK
ncbi:nuclear export mediator factor NEMF homolog isoform X1 [Harpegnathos saltator]|uniref:Serologically defined colon cancer antigen 1-like protein n=1 Tax=Harpegnathos saltator TaxID=610380 RepID=E2BDI6_HARSA|nr:nuclear export mediator factor NEMF homolog isoform X1 [Harpegnathos saltator]EFN86238.1 Serologically defined colon cancer antigen 1-like protein [Harpegnathos saltator]